MRKSSVWEVAATIACLILVIVNGVNAAKADGEVSKGEYQILMMLWLVLIFAIRGFSFMGRRDD